MENEVVLEVPALRYVAFINFFPTFYRCIHFQPMSSIIAVTSSLTALFFQGPAGKNGETGPQGPPGPTVSSLAEDEEESEGEWGGEKAAGIASSQTLHHFSSPEQLRSLVASLADCCLTRSRDQIACLPCISSVNSFLN